MTPHRTKGQTIIVSSAKIERTEKLDDGRSLVLGTCNISSVAYFYFVAILVSGEAVTAEVLNRSPSFSCGDGTYSRRKAVEAFELIISGAGWGHLFRLS